MEAWKRYVLLLSLLPMVSFGEYLIQDTSTAKEKQFSQETIYLKDAILPANRKIVKGGVEYPGGKYFRELPQMIASSNRAKHIVEKAIRRRQRIENIALIGGVVSLVSIYSGINQNEETRTRLGFVVLLYFNHFVAKETIRFNNKLNHAVHIYNLSVE